MDSFAHPRCAGGGRRPRISLEHLAGSLELQAERGQQPAGLPRLVGREVFVTQFDQPVAEHLAPLTVQALIRRAVPVPGPQVSRHTEFKEDYFSDGLP
jgi:hypothetical protein